MGEVSPTSITCNAAVSACSRTGQWAQVLELLTAMQRQGLAHDVYTFLNAICACNNGGASYVLADIVRQLGSHMLSLFGLRAPSSLLSSKRLCDKKFANNATDVFLKHLPGLLRTQPLEVLFLGNSYAQVLSELRGLQI